MPRCAAGQQRDLVDGTQVGVGDGHLVEMDLAGLERRPAEHRVAHGMRLLEDFLEHEMLVAGLLCGDRIPGDARRRALDRFPVERHELNALRRDDRHFAIVEKDHVAGVAENRGHVRRHEIFAVADADDDRRAIADRHELLRIVGRHQHEREQAAHALHGAQAPRSRVRRSSTPSQRDAPPLRCRSRSRTCGLRRPAPS